MPDFHSIFVSILPRRYWRGASGAGILISSFLQLGFSAAWLVSVYTRFAQEASDGLASTTLEASLMDPTINSHIQAGHAMAANALTPLAFLVVSRAGQVAAYLVFSALVRLLAFATDHPCGDPGLTMVDSYAWDFIYFARSKVRNVWGFAWSWWTR